MPTWASRSTRPPDCLLVRPKLLTAPPLAALVTNVAPLTFGEVLMNIVLCVVLTPSTHQKEVHPCQAQPLQPAHTVAQGTAIHATASPVLQYN